VYAYSSIYTIIDTYSYVFSQFEHTIKLLFSDCLLVGCLLLGLVLVWSCWMLYL